MTNLPPQLVRLAQRRTLGMRFDLDRLRAALKCLGDPHQSFPALHVAGTNGKGSTAAMACALLRSQGLRVGLYTSPHLVDFAERIVVDGEMIDQQALDRLLERVLSVGDELSFFDVATATAFAYFAEKAVDVAVVEVGLGGRLDSTNLVNAAVSAITSISLDHCAVLGGTIEQIAAEKAGIIRRSVPVVCTTQAPEVTAVIASRCRELSAPLISAVERTRVLDDQRVCYRSARCVVAPMAVPLAGRYQLDNAAIALAAVDEMAAALGRQLDLDALRSAWTALSWPGRFERVGPLILDGAHNPAGIAALSAELQAPIDLIYGQQPGRDPLQMLAPLRSKLRGVTFVRIPGVLSVEPAELRSLAGYGEVADDLVAALNVGAPTLVTGSIYLVGAVRALCLGRPLPAAVLSDPSSRQ
ncbi:MAG: bifunctional folylpolyglutamate synthase/dihydrofolate synthase [Deltaproteobacteria bacterium]|nr:bifunctional folylpolyglutamate synthase/dihydrofolate synthase [Deltaproteobacteria bacterium]